MIEKKQKGRDKVSRLTHNQELVGSIPTPSTKKKYKIKPKARIKKVFDKVIESGGIKPVSVAMVEVGYSPASATNPQKITESKSWQVLLDEYLPDEFLAEKHKELFDKEEVVVRNNVATGQVDVIPTGQIDVQARKAALDMAYKIKGRYKEDGKITVNAVFGIVHKQLANE